MRRVLAGLLAMLLLVGCQPDFPTGRVLRTWYEPAETFMLLMPLTTCNGKSCTTIFIPVWWFDDEDWMVEVQSVTDSDSTATWKLTHERWEAVEIGSIISKDGTLPNANTRVEPPA